MVRRREQEGELLFAINHSESAAKTSGSGVELLTGDLHECEFLAQAGKVVVLKDRVRRTR